MEREFVKLNLLNDIKTILIYIGIFLRSIIIQVHFIIILLINRCKGFKLLEITEDYVSSYRNIDVINEMVENDHIYNGNDIRLGYLIFIFSLPLHLFMILILKLILTTIICLLYPIYLVSYIIDKMNRRI